MNRTERQIVRLAACAAAMLLALVPTRVACGDVRLEVRDAAWDDGKALEVAWDGAAAPEPVVTWVVERSLTPDEAKARRRTERIDAATASMKKAKAEGIDPKTALFDADRAATMIDMLPLPEWEEVARLGRDEVGLSVGGLVEGTGYRIRLVGLDADGRLAVEAISDQVAPQGQVFHGKRLWFGILLALIATMVITAILAARRGKVMKVRKIAGLEAIDEAVGRATEMGRPVLFVPGIQDMNDLQTVAGVTVLGRVAKVAAEYDAVLEVPTARSLVMTAAREAVQASYLSAGRSDAFNPDRINYITDEQFGYVAYLAGTMTRERPATCIYMGAFYAESLLLAENGNSIGAIQIAGTAESSQLPFFVAACDYTLIGEEFFAASAYLSGEPMQLGSLRGQDLVKMITLVLIVAGVLLATLASIAPDTGASSAFTYLRGSILAR